MTVLTPCFSSPIRQRDLEIEDTAILVEGMCGLDVSTC